MLETSKTIVVSIDQTALKISLEGVSNLGNEGVGLDSFVNKAYYDVIRGHKGLPDIPWAVLEILPQERDSKIHPRKRYSPGNNKIQ